MAGKKSTIEIRVPKHQNDDKHETYRRQFSNSAKAQAWVNEVVNQITEERGNMWPFTVKLNGQAIRYDQVAMLMDA